MPLVEDDDAVAVADGAQPMGDDQSGAGQLLQVVGHLFLRNIVQCRSRLVEEQNTGLGNERTGDEQTLLLATAETASAFAHHGVKLHGHAPDVLVDAGQA